MDKRFLSSADAAIFLGVSRPLIEKLVARREIPSYKIGKRRLFDKEELVEWVKVHRNDTEKKPKPSPSRKRKGE